MIKNFLCCCCYWYKDAKNGGSYGQISVDGAFISVNGRETRLAPFLVALTVAIAKRERSVAVRGGFLPIVLSRRQSMAGVPVQH